MPLFRRHFSLEDARAELPRLRQELAELQTAGATLQENLNQISGAIEHASENGGSSATGRLLATQRQVAELLSRITERGIQIKDPERGLVDFPHIRHGQEVLLCWMLSEDDIRFWHTPDEGFGGRRPITE